MKGREKELRISSKKSSSLVNRLLSRFKNRKSVISLKKAECKPDTITSCSQQSRGAGYIRDIIRLAFDLNLNC